MCQSIGYLTIGLQYRAECEAQLQKHITLLNDLKESRSELLSQLEDEKKKNEDWQFKFEETEIIRADLEVCRISLACKEV